MFSHKYERVCWSYIIWLSYESHEFRRHLIKIAPVYTIHTNLWNHISWDVKLFGILIELYSVQWAEHQHFLYCVIEITRFRSFHEMVSWNRNSIGRVKSTTQQVMYYYIENILYLKYRQYMFIYFEYHIIFS